MRDAGGPKTNWVIVLADAPRTRGALLGDPPRSLVLVRARVGLSRRHTDGAGDALV